MPKDKDTIEKLLAWHRVLLGEAGNVAYRLDPRTDPTDNFLDDLASSLESLAIRVRREMKKG